MTDKGVMKFQIGKNGLTGGIVESLRNAFKTHKIVRVSVLKSAVRDRKKLKELASELAGRLGKNFKFKIIGYTIVVKRSSSYSKPT